MRDETRSSLSTTAARNLATITKSRPQTQGITPRWLLKLLPWVEVRGGVFRLNRRAVWTDDGGPLSFTEVGGQYNVIPASLAQLPELWGFQGTEALSQVAALFTQRTLDEGTVLVNASAPSDRIWLVAEGRLETIRTDQYGVPTTRAALGEGDALRAEGTWPHTVRTLTRTKVLGCDRKALDALIQSSEPLRTHTEQLNATRATDRDKYGQPLAPLSAGHTGEPELPQGFIDYDPSPLEVPLSVAQTILRVHTRVTDLLNGPMNQFEEQLRLTIEALRETQESEMLNNPVFGLLPTVHPKQRLRSSTGRPTPADLDALLCRRHETKFFLAHPRAIAAFGRECTRLGVYPEAIPFHGQTVHTWRRVPLLPSDKIPIKDGLTSILAVRAGVDNDGVIALHQTGIPNEVQPSVNARFMGIDDKAVGAWLVSAYYAVVAQIPNATGVLTGVGVDS